LYGNWIKILGLNQVRKEKEKQRRQPLENVRNQREGKKATTEDEEETRDPEEESSTIELREEKLSRERKGATQSTKVLKSRKNEDNSSNQEKVSNKPNTSNQNSQKLPTATLVEKKDMMIFGQRNQYLKTKCLFWGGKNLTQLNEEKTFNWDLELVQCNDKENGLNESNFE
jgi:hypothetical protein